MGHAVGTQGSIVEDAASPDAQESGKTFAGLAAAPK